MKEYFDCLIMTHGTAFGVGAAIFLLTILLVAKRVIGFVLSLILLLIALGASWAINNETIVRGYLDKWIPTTQTSRTQTSTQTTPSSTHSETSPSAAPPSQTAIPSQGTNLRGQVESEKGRVQNFLEETHPAINPEK